MFAVLSLCICMFVDARLWIRSRSFKTFMRLSPRNDCPEWATLSTKRCWRSNWNHKCYYWLLSDKLWIYESGEALSVTYAWHSMTLAVVYQGVTVLNADRKQPDQLKRAIAAATETVACCTMWHQGTMNHPWSVHWCESWACVEICKDVSSSQSWIHLKSNGCLWFWCF